MSARKEWLAVAALAVLGAALRFYHLGTQSLWLDELFSVALARHDFATIVAGTAADIAPPLYYVLLHLAMQFGTDEVAVRVVSCLAGVATVPVLYVLARDLFDRRVALIATLVLAVNPFHIFYAQEARMYTLFGLLSLLAMLFFMRAWRMGRRLDWALLALVTVLDVYTHSTALLCLFALDVFAALNWRTALKHWKGLAATHVAVVIAFLPWALTFARQATRVETEFSGASQSPFTLAATPYLFLFSVAVPTILVPVALFAGLALLAFALAAAARTLRAGGAGAEQIEFSLVVFAVPPLVLYLVSLVYPIYVERRLLPASFGLYLIVAWAIANAKPRVLNAGLGAGVVLLAMVSISNYYYNPTQAKPAMREAAQELSGKFGAGDAVAHTSDSSALAFQYYAPGLPNAFLAGDPDYVTDTNRGRAGVISGLVPMPAADVVADHSRVWLVVALDHNVDYQKEQIRAFDASLNRVEKDEIAGIGLFLYEVRR